MVAVVVVVAVFMIATVFLKNTVFILMFKILQRLNECYFNCLHGLHEFGIMKVIGNLVWILMKFLLTGYTAP